MEVAARRATVYQLPTQRLRWSHIFIVTGLIRAVPSRFLATG